MTPIPPAPQVDGSLPPGASLSSPSAALIFGGWAGADKPALKEVHTFYQGAVAELKPTGAPPAGRHKHAAAWVSGRFEGLLIAGGVGDGKRVLTDVWLLQRLSADAGWAWCEVATHVDALDRKFHACQFLLPASLRPPGQPRGGKEEVEMVVFGGLRSKGVTERMGDVQVVKIRRKDAAEYLLQQKKGETATANSPANDSPVAASPANLATTPRRTQNGVLPPVSDAPPLPLMGGISPTLKDFNKAALDVLGEQDDGAANCEPRTVANGDGVSATVRFEAEFATGEDLPAPEEMYKWSLLSDEAPAPNSDPSPTQRLHLLSSAGQMLPREKMFTARTGHAVFSFRDQVFVFGGTDEDCRLNDVKVCTVAPFGTAKDPSFRPADIASIKPACPRQAPGVWANVSCSGQPPSSRSSARACVIEDCAFVFGGYTRKEGDHFNDLYKLDLKTFHWTALPHRLSHAALEEGRQAQVKAQTDARRATAPAPPGDDGEGGGLSAAGGELAAGQLADLLAKHIPGQRTDHAQCELQGKGWVSGGCNTKTRFGDLYSFTTTGEWTLECAGGKSLSKKSSSNQTNPWASASCPFTPRFGHSIVGWGSSIFSFGGWDGKETLSQLLEFSTLRKEWQLLTDAGQAPKGRYRHTSVLHGCNMFVFGGVDAEQQRFNDLHVLDLSTLTWSFVQTVDIPPTPRTFHQAVLVGHNMVVVGGFDGKRRNDSHQILVKRGDTNRDQVRRVLKQNRLRISDNGRLVNLDDDLSPKLHLAFPLAQLPDTIKSYRGELPLSTIAATLGMEKALLALAAELERVSAANLALEEQIMCKICLSKRASVLMEPCMHKLACVSCAAVLDHCPICRREVRRRVEIIDC